jgi:CPA1 family monovalent cation:H+ antiporter
LPFASSGSTRLSRSLREREPKPRKRELFIISWCGMRGIVSLAAALALPVTLPNGEPFPYRDLIVFLTFFVIATTLIGQGLTLSPFIRGLKVGADWEGEKERERARAAMRRAALTAIETAADTGRASPALVKVLQAEFSGVADPEETIRTAGELAHRIRRSAIEAERRALIALWRNNEIGDEVLHHLEELLDYREAQLKG